MSEDATLDDFVETEKQESSNLELGPIEVDIPDEWSSTELSTVFNLITGNNYSGDHLSDEDNGGRIFLTLKSVNKGGGFNWDSLKYYTGEVNEREIVEPGELLIANTDVTQDGDIVGYSIRVPEFDSKKEIAASMDLSILRPTSDNINLPFVEYLLQTDYIHSRMRAFSAGSTVLHLNTDLVESLSLPLPCLSEQRKIATVLYNVDQAIKKTEEIIEQTNRVRRGFIRERVVAANSEDERKEGTVGTRRVTVPEHWSTVRLGDVAEIVSGKSFPREYQEGHAGPRAVIKVEDMNLPGNDKCIEDVTNRVTQEVLEELNKNIFPADTVIHPRVGEALLLNKTRITTEEAAFDDNIMGWIPDGINPEYLYYASTLVDFNAVAQTGTVPSINKEMAANFRFPLPPEDEQEQIAEDLSRIDGQVSIYEEEKTQLQRLKQGLMQDLLSGTVRTTDTNIEVPEEVAQHG
jgi:type I restriction enzyme S subunit